MCSTLLAFRHETEHSQISLRQDTLLLIQSDRIIPALPHVLTSDCQASCLMDFQPRIHAQSLYPFGLFTLLGSDASWAILF